ncbi:MAG: UDP-3-O-(3-hydroxymyristoyl)glucosamine N-acyltransferase [Steroidobacteraceae bacterium]
MNSAGVSLGELAVRFGCTLRGDPAAVVIRVATLETATSDALSFLANPKYRVHLAQTHAGAVVLDVASADACSVPVLIAKNPYLTYARIAAELHPPPLLPAGIHVSAIVDVTAQIDSEAHIGPNVVIGAGCRIAARAMIGPGCVLGNNVIVGADTRLQANVTLCDGTVLGERCLISPNAVIGSEGFGFAPDPASGWVKVPQIGAVKIGNDVEIGASTTIDRGAIGDTVIADGVKLDNQIQIAHNVQIGKHTAMAAFVGVSGSTTIGSHCMIAGQVGIAGHLSICDNVVVTGKSMVSASIRKPGVYSGALHVEEARKFRRNAARFAQLDELAKQVRRLSGTRQVADEQLAAEDDNE